MKPKEFKEKIKKPFKAKYEPKVEAEGYSMALGIGSGSDGNYSLEVRLQPMEGSPDAIPEDLFDRIKNDVLPDQYKGHEVNVEYLGMVRPRED